MIEQTPGIEVPVAEFRLTEEGYRANAGLMFDRHFAVRRPASRALAIRIAQTFFVPVGVLMSVLCVLLLLGGHPAGRQFARPMAVGSLIGLVFVLVMLASESRDARRARFVSNRKSRLRVRFPRRYRVSIEPDGLTIETDEATETSGWSAIRAVTDEGGCFLFHTRLKTTFSVPRSCFSSPSDADAFLAAARAYVSGSKETSRVRDFLATNSVKCAACGHDLRGTEGDLCPECGTVVDPGKIRGLDD